MSSLRLYRAAGAVLMAALLPAGPANADEFELKSPDGGIGITVAVEEGIRWSVTHGGKTLLEPSAIDMVVADGGSIAHGSSVAEVTRDSVDRQIRPAVAHKSSSIRDHYNELSVLLDNGFQVQFRAYDRGAAYRFTSTLDRELVIKHEVAQFNFPKQAVALFPEEESFISHFEPAYVKTKLSDLDVGRLGSVPAYVDVNDLHVVITDADLFDYPGLLLRGTGKNSLAGTFSGYVTRTTPTKGSEDRNEQVERADYIAVTDGDRVYPWRVLVASDHAAALVESQLVYLLSRENRIGDTDWIKPGKIAWDWYNANNLYGVDFEAGINTQTYKYYIDFAAEYDLEYVILDEGWTKTTTNLLESSPEMDVQALIDYGKKKGVGIILWTLWKPLNQDYQKILATYAEWGAAGIKVDFMQRADQWMVNYYEKIAREAAKHQLLVNYHGGFKPSGLRRAYPNVLTYEAVKGNENNKWSQAVTPEHTVTLPFTRMVAGPMDFTPGAMFNAHPINHHVSFARPVSIGTRTHQVAMYAVYESALQMLCESPSTYYREKEVTEFIARFPTVWDETRVLDAQVGDYILVARRSGSSWYLGAMTDATARRLEVDFSFLGGGEYRIDQMADGPNAERYAQDYTLESGPLNAGQRMTVKLASGGGWAAIVTAKRAEVDDPL